VVFFTETSKLGSNRVRLKLLPIITSVNFDDYTIKETRVVFILSTCLTIFIIRRWGDRQHLFVSIQLQQ